MRVSPVATNILISLEPKYAEAILSGEKVFELRRRRFQVEPGTRVWLYAKMPQGALVGHATIKRIHEASPASVWRKFGSRSCISRQDFLDYFAGRVVGYAIELFDSSRLIQAIPLHELRARHPNFHPPQFFKRIDADDRLLQQISKLR